MKQLQWSWSFRVLDAIGDSILLLANPPPQSPGLVQETIAHAHTDTPCHTPGRKCSELVGQALTTALTGFPLQANIQLHFLPEGTLGLVSHTLQAGSDKPGLGCTGVSPLFSEAGGQACGVSWGES